MPTLLAVLKKHLKTNSEHFSTFLRKHVFLALLGDHVVVALLGDHLLNHFVALLWKKNYPTT